MTQQFQRKTHRARRILEAVGKAFPGAWQQFDAFRQQRGSARDFDWPEWCYMPIAAGDAIVHGDGPRVLSRAHLPALLTAMATWRMTQGIYRYDPAIYPEILDTPIDAEIPAAVLYRMPEWCAYIETPGLLLERQMVHGVWAHLECDVARNGQAELRLIYDCAPDPRQPLAAESLPSLPLILTGGTIADSMQALDASARRQAEKMGFQLPAGYDQGVAEQREVMARVLSLVLYLCSTAPDITRRGQVAAPTNPKPLRSGAGRWVLHPASGPAEWDVGVRIGAALRAAYAREETGGEAAATGRHVRPHVRRAHWHTILSGARKRDDGSAIPSTERRADLRWMPPIPIAITDAGELPAVIHKVTP